MTTKNEIPHFWHSLRWSIMLKFLMVSILTWFIGTQIGVMLEYWHLVRESPPEKIAAEIKPELPIFAALWENKNLTALNLQMRETAGILKVRQRRIGRYFYYNIEQNVFAGKAYAELIFLNRNGEIVDGLTAYLGGEENGPPPALSGDEKDMVWAALDGQNRTVRINETNTNLLAFPVRNQNGAITGVLFVRERVPFVWWEAFAKSFRDFLNDLLNFWLTVAICGFLFGFLQAHQIAHRLDRIAVAVKAWSKGDFAARASEKNFDELGRLARTLNEMAKSLEEVFSIRQELAMSEERNRIARDLHDSVKQQVFGLALQIGAAQVMLDTNPEATAVRLAEAENLVGRVQSELVNLISELRPQTNESFADKLRIYAEDWSRQSGIRAKISLDRKAEFSPDIENTLFRILQESLANVARHSRAGEVSIVSECANNEFRLSISDNGKGFDSSNTNDGFGLQTMKERAETLKNGAITVESDRGTKITVKFETE